MTDENVNRVSEKERVKTFTGNFYIIKLLRNSDLYVIIIR